VTTPPTGNGVLTVFHSSRSPALAHAQLKRLRPTQLTVGYAECELKARQWAQLGKKQRKIEIERHVFPAVIGLGHDYFIVDHHHLGIALIEEGIDEVPVAVLDDLSWLEPAVFWRTMEYRSWAHPYDNRGNRREYGDIPQRLTQLENDPYRSLAGLVRNAGGFAKDQAPFVEFLWADFFRPHVAARMIKSDPRRATREGVRLAQSKQARYLPGWSGKASA
jgi:hypothetical protein